MTFQVDRVTNAFSVTFTEKICNGIQPEQITFSRMLRLREIRRDVSDSDCCKGRSFENFVLFYAFARGVFITIKSLKKRLNMSIFLHFICGVVISFLVWFIFGMILLSPQFGIIGTDIFGPANTPISTIIIAASIFAIAQGSLMSIFILWQKSNTILGHCFFSFIATEILLFVAMLTQSILFMRKNQITYNSSNLFQGIIFFIFWYFVLSLVFLIPALVIGVATRKVLNITN